MLQYWANIGHYYAAHGIVTVIANHQLVPQCTFPAGKLSIALLHSFYFSSVRLTISGARDMQLLRDWVYKNIASERFGQGSPLKVILWGHSSGGAHIAMNLYGGADAEHPARDPLFPPVAGVIYFSTPFWYDSSRPIRNKILRQYYGSAEEDVWGVSPTIVLRDLSTID